MPQDIYFNDGAGNIRKVPANKVDTFKKYFPKATQADESQLSEIESKRAAQSEKAGNAKIVAPEIKPVNTRIVGGGVSFDEGKPLAETATDVYNIHKTDPEISFRAKYGAYKQDPALFRDKENDATQTTLPSIADEFYKKNKKSGEMESIQDFLTNTQQGRGFVDYDKARQKYFADLDFLLTQEITNLEREIKEKGTARQQLIDKPVHGTRYGVNPQWLSADERAKIEAAKSQDVEEADKIATQDDLNLAAQNLQELKMLQAAVNDRNANAVAQFFNEAGRRLPKSLYNIGTMGFGEVVEGLDPRKGGELSNRSEGLLSQYASLHQQDRTIAQDIAQGTVGSLEFMAQFVGAGGVVSGLTKNIGKTILTAGAKKAATKGAGKVLKIAGREVSESLMQTAIMPSTIAMAIENNAQNPGSFLDSFANAYLSNLVEVGSERIGQFMPGPKFKLPASVQKLQKATGIDGMVGEFLEEQIATVGHSALGDGQAEWSDLVNPRQQLITAGVVGIIQLPYASINAAGYAAGKFRNINQKRSINKAFTQNMEAMNAFFGTDTKPTIMWLNNAIDKAQQSGEGISSIMTSIVNQGDFTEEQTNAILNYGLSYLAKKGLETAKEEQIQNAQAEARQLAEQAVNLETNSIILATVPGMEEPTRIQGNVILREDGSIDAHKSGEIYYTDAEGKRKVIDPKFIEIVENVPAEQAIEELSTMKAAEVVNQQANDEVRPYEPGEVVRFTSDGNVSLLGQIQGADESGNYQVIVDGVPAPVIVEPRMIINEDNLQGVDNGILVDYRDDAGNVLTGTVDDMSIRGHGVIVIDGNEIRSENVIGVHQERENEAPSTIKTSEETPRNEGVTTGPVQQNETETAETGTESQITAEQQQAEQAEAEKQEFMQSLPVVESGKNKGQIDQSQMTPEQNIRYFEYQYGKEKAVQAAMKMSENLTKRIKKEQEKLDNDPFNIAQNELVDQLQAQMEAYKNYAFARMQEQTERNIAVQSGPSVTQSKQQRSAGIQQEEAGRTGTAEPTIKEKWDAADKIEGIEDVITLASGEKIPGRYILTTADAPSPSHDIERNFAKTKGFPTNEQGNTVNDRDYESDKTAQTLVQQRANKYDEQAVQNPVVVSRDGIVISGNDRTMAGKIAARNGTDKAYVDYITKYADRWGFTPEMVTSMQAPRIVFVPDVELPYNTATFAKFNAEDKKTQSTLERAIKSSKSVSREIIIPISEVVDGFNSLAEFYADSNATQKVLQVLTRNSIVQPNEIPRLMDGDVFSVEGRSFLETLLLGAVLQEQALREVDAMRSVRQSLMRIMPQLARNAALSDYTLIPELNNAIHLLYESKRSGSKVKLHLMQTNVFEASPADVYAEIEKLIAIMLENARDTEIRAIFESYNKEAAAIESGQTNMFDGVLSKPSLLTLILNKYGQQAEINQQDGSPSQGDGQGEGNRSGHPTGSGSGQQQPKGQRSGVNKPQSSPKQTISKGEKINNIFASVSHLVPVNRQLWANTSISRLQANKILKDIREFQEAAVENGTVEYKEHLDRHYYEMVDGKEIKINTYKLNGYTVEIGDEGHFSSHGSGLYTKVENPQGEVVKIYDPKYRTEKTNDISYQHPRFIEKQSEPAGSIEAEAAKVDVNPTEAQKEAGNYKKGHVNIAGFEITIENPKGSERSGTDPSGRKWTRTLKSHYGYFKRTKGKDGDQIDVFIGENPESRFIFVVDQLNQDGTFDEHKVMLGYDSFDRAKEAYLENYEEGWQGLGAMTVVEMEDFRKWLDSDSKRIKPFSEYKQIQETIHETEKAEQPSGAGPIEIDVEGLFGALRTKGEAKLSDHVKPQEDEKPAYGANNKIITQERYNELREQMRKKLNNLNVGFDPEVFSIGAQMAMYHIESGAHKFADFAKRMVDDLGDAIRPYLKASYEGARAMPGMEELSKTMDPYKEVQAFDVNHAFEEQQEGSQKKQFTFKQESPMAYGKAMKIMEKRYRYPDGKVMTRYEWIESLPHGLEVRTVKVAAKNDEGYREELWLNQTTITKTEQDYYEYLQQGGMTISDHLAEEEKKAIEDEKKLIEERKAKEEERRKQNEIAQAKQDQNRKDTIVSALQSTRDEFINIGTKSERNYIESFNNRRRKDSAYERDLAVANNNLEARRGSAGRFYDMAKAIYILNKAGNPVRKYNYKVGDKVVVTAWANPVETVIQEVKGEGENAMYVVEKRDGIHNQHVHYDSIRPAEKVTITKEQKTKETETIKEPWQMTKGEFDEIYNNRRKQISEKHGDIFEDASRLYMKLNNQNTYPRTEKILDILNDGNKDVRPEYADLMDRYAAAAKEIGELNAEIGHDEAVDKAISEGKPVPAEVLAAYPHLERKQRILSEGTLFDDIFGLIHVKNIKTAEDVLSNIDKILQSLKSNEGSGKFKSFEGFANGGKYGKNAGEQIRQYMLSLDVLPNELQKEFVEMIGADNYKKLHHWAWRRYDEIESVADYAQKVVDADKGRKESKTKSIVEKSDKVEKIEDFGEKIEGAKKDTWRKNTSTSDDIKSQPLSKCFPRPDLAKLVDDGSISVDGALILKYLYDGIPSKPRKKYKLSAWTSRVQEVIDVMNDFIDSPENVNAYMDKVNRMPGYFNDQISLYFQVQKLLGFPNEDVNIGKYEIKKFAGRDGYSIVKSPYIIGDYKTIDEAVNSLKNKIKADKASISKDEVKLSLYQDSGTKKYFIGKKGATGIVRLMDNIETIEEARTIFKEQQPQLQEMWRALKINPEERRVGNRDRIGTDYRKGKDINPEEFSETFGFRGVQFGNWVNNDERQSSLNEAYDALMDLSTAIGVSTRAISLDGELGLAFGARGSGKFNAHYEPGQVVINLTKTKGAGSLAHEWWHAIDNYFSRMRGEKSAFITEKPRQGITGTGQMDERVRKEMIDSFKNLVTTINKSELPKRSGELDKTRSKAYWSTIVEMSARSFENFIIEKMAQTNESNDYLANFKELSEWAGQGGLDAKSYPYPTKEESELINSAYQDFFDTIQEKVDEETGNTILFRKVDESGFYSTVEDALEQIKQEKGTPDQFKAMLLKNGAKQAELDWMGWDERFGTDHIDPKMTVGGQGVKLIITKSEIQDWINQNRIEVQEVEKGKYGIQNNVPREQWVNELTVNEIPDSLRDGGDWVDENGNLILYDDYGENYIDSFIRSVGDYFNKEFINRLSNDTKFSQYTLPGGKNYKELLLTMQTEGPKPTNFHRENGIWIATRNEEEIDRDENISVLRDRTGNDYTSLAKDGRFKSSHFDEPNILAHVRFNDREVNGERVLFIEEIQSDWAQQGKKHGFADGKTVQKIKDNLEQAQKKRKEISDKIDNEFPYLYDKKSLKKASYKTPEIYRLNNTLEKIRNVKEYDEIIKQIEREEQKQKDIYNEWEEADNEFRKLSDKLDAAEREYSKNKAFGAPDMPFKKTDQWVNLALRRMMMYAAENGYDRIAWTTGEQQADRYDLSKQISELEIRTDEEDSNRVAVWVNNNLFKYANKEELPDIIGKEMAKKAISDLETRKNVYYSGLDLKVGGEGMIAFYDQIVPKAAKKLGKPFGADVETINLPISNEEITQNNADDEVEELTYKYESGELELDEFISEMNKIGYNVEVGMDGEVESANRKGAVYKSVQSIPVTDALREIAPNGMPLFRKRDTEAREAYAMREWNRAKKAIDELAAKMGVSVEIIETTDGLPKAKAEAKGWYDTKSKKIAIVMPNHSNSWDAQATFLHEAVGHHGLRELFGEHFDTFLDNVYNNAEEEIKAQINKKAQDKGWAVRKATEEYLSELAEDQEILQSDRLSGFFNSVKKFFFDMLAKIGFNPGFKLSNNELKYILWRSYQNLAEPGRYRSVVDQAKDVAMQYGLKVGNYEEKTPMANVAEEPGAELPATITINGVERSTTNSNGNPIATTEQGVRNFWRWFGDSKVADKEGRPLVVYHGSDREFTVFSNNHEGNIKSDPAGYYFSMYSGTARAYGNFVQSFYLDLKNPYIANTYDEGANITKEKIESLKNEGFDGVIYDPWTYKKTIEKWMAGDLIEYVAFDPSQIKSVENTGTFDPDNDDIRYRSVSDAADEIGSKMPEDLRNEYDVKYNQFFTRFREAWEDTYLPVKNFLDLLRNNNVEISDYNDFYKQATHLQGKNDAQLKIFKDMYQHPITIAINALENKGFKYRDIENYVFAKHGLERNEFMRNAAIQEWDNNHPDATDDQRAAFIDSLPSDYAGITALEEEFGTTAQEYIDDFEERAGGVPVGNLWTAINNATKWTLEKQYKTGMMSKDTYDELTGRYQYYVPLRGHDKETAEDRWDYTPDMGTYFTAPLLKAEGRRSRAESPFAYVAQMAHSAIAQGNKNTLKQSILRLAQKDNGGLMSATKTWKVNIGTADNPIWEQQSAPYSEDVDTYLDNQRIFEERMQELKNDGMAYQGRTRLNIGDLFIKQRQAEQHEIQVYQNGISHTVYINANPAIARAINGANRKDVSQNLGFIANVTRSMAANFTTRNPLFIMTNFSRDYIFSSTMLLAKETPKFAGQFQMNIPKALGALQRYERGKVNLNNKPDRYLYEYLINGGKTGFSHIFELDRVAKSLEREAKKGGSKNLKDHGIAVLNVIDTFNEIAENTTRLSAYITSRENGRNITDSVNDAKNITVNFNQKGAGSSVGKNSFEQFIFSAAGWVRPLYLFTNAAVQALSNVLKVTAKHPIKMASIIASYSLLGFISPLLAQLFGGDDGEEAYLKLTDWERQNNWCILLPNGSFLKIPLPHELRVFHRLGDNIYQSISGKQDVLQTLLDTMFSIADLLPMNPMGSAKTSWAELVPDAIRPFAQLITNTNFMGSKVYNEWANKNMPGYLKARTNKKGEYYAPNFMVDWFMYIDHITGGDSVKKGVISLNPDIANHLLRGYFGGLYTLAEQGVGIASETYNLTQTGEFNMKIRETPLKTFYADKNDLRIESSGLSSKYYEVSNKVSEARRRDKGYFEKVKSGEMAVDEYARRTQELNMENVNNLYDRIREIRKIEQGLKEMDPDQQKEAERMIFNLKKEVVDMNNLH